MTILVIGGKGMAGHIISMHLIENTDWNIISWGRKEFEIEESGSWKNKILELNQDHRLNYIINCIGILKPVANPNPILAMKINALFPHELAKLCSGIKAKVIHLSTDCWNDLDFYGRSKRAGELDYQDHLTVRSSIMGPELKDDGSGIFHWFMIQKDTINGFSNHYWDGVTTLELSKRIKEIIETKPGMNGIKELRTRTKVSKLELLNYIKDSFHKNITINKKETQLLDKTNDKSEMKCEIPLKDQVVHLKEWMANHPRIYKKYLEK